MAGLPHTASRESGVEAPGPRVAGPSLELDPRVADRLVAGMPVGLLVEDPRGRCWINEELRRIWMRGEPAPVRAGELEAALRPATASDTKPWGRLLAGAGIPRFGPWRKYSLQRGNGTRIPVRAWTSVVWAQANHLAATYVVEDGPPIPDSELRDAFLAMVGHELRSPITSVVAGAELLRTAELEPATRAEVAGLLVEEAHRVNMLVEQMTSLTLLQAAGASLLSEPVHLIHLARRVGVRELARRSALDLRLPTLEPIAAVALGDEGFIEQVLTILIDNAAKYASNGPAVELQVRPAGDEVAVHLLDRGPGLGTAEPERLFDLFQRARADGGVPAGSGIGLFVAKQLVTAMHGRIWARDRDGGGSDFGFALPAAR
jgi:signal transduction histidine kinase